MTADPYSLLREHVSDGAIDTDELTLTEDGGRYQLSVAGTRYEDLSADELRATLTERHPAHLREWAFWHHFAPHSPARRAFLRWVEDADEKSPSTRRSALTEGVEQAWGQLHLSVRLRDDRRTYELRHVDDVGRPSEQLDAHDDPLDARRIAKYDDDGRYRPLSTAPTLQTGWLFSGIDAAAAVRTVEFFYPATIANWHREQTGTLDVTHWEEAAGRQTGIYAVTSELEGEAVDWTAEACCVDSQCLKRRRWDERADRALAVPRGEGPFPCREPCSLVIAAARKWALQEREEERTYTIRLTPSEKEQLEGLLEAVADGTVGDVRDADVGGDANRYRARFLRAKRAEKGELPFSASEE